METYKVAKVSPTGEGYLDMVTTDGRRVPALVPHVYADFLRHGTRIMVHRNRAGRVVACSFADNMVFMEWPTAPESIASFANGFKDIYDLSLDSIWFKYALGRSLRRMGMIPTGRLMVDIMSYNYIHGR